jgi:hypothetical protein
MVMSVCGYVVVLWLCVDCVAVKSLNEWMSVVVNIRNIESQCQPQTQQLMN